MSRQPASATPTSSSATSGIPCRSRRSSATRARAPSSASARPSRGVAPGDRVGMTFDSCGHCPTCQSGRPAYCHGFFAHNFASTRGDGTSALSRDGELIHGHFFGQSCFATHAVAGERNVVRLPDEIALRRRGAVRLRHPDRRRRGAELAARAGRQQHRDLRHRVGRTRGGAWAQSIAGCTTIIGIDVNSARLALARELGATARDRRARRGRARADRPRSPAGGPTSASRPPACRRCCARPSTARAPAGVCGLIGAPRFGTEVSLDVNTILTAGQNAPGNRGGR